MVQSTVVPFELPSKFFPDPLTEVIRAGAKERLRTAVQAKVAAVIAEHVIAQADAGLIVEATRAIEGDLDADIGCGGLAGDDALRIGALLAALPALSHPGPAREAIANLPLRARDPCANLGANP